ncbi:hypothetical protein FOA52_002356 [Chlamydomonas sp. UWO 241]|nr:hypothetical protein FOA52_002356 [Chlamydomonas sp. UWO 241]
MEAAAATTAPEQAEDEWAARGLRPTLVRGSLRDVEDLESGLMWERFLYWHVQGYDGRCLVQKSSLSAASARALFDRAIELRDALAARVLTLREDSALCSDFIALGVGSVPRIVGTMEEMNWLYKHTKYPCYRKYTDLAMNEDGDEDLRDEVSELAKQAAVYKYAVLDEEPPAHMPPRLLRMLDNDDSNDALSCAWNTYEAGEDMAESVYERRRSMKDIWGGWVRW